jgi:hypothetical protein
MSPVCRRLAALLGPALALGSAATAQPSVFVTANGMTVDTPAIAGLDCDGLRRVLDAIDATGYRGADPLPADEADMALMDYENRVSAAYYETCVHAEAEATPAQDAFLRGYGQ